MEPWPYTNPTTHKPKPRSIIGEESRQLVTDEPVEFEE
jgi:hypothetical protein